jgi:nucleotide-binding universal stress UspA family protein
VRRLVEVRQWAAGLGLPSAQMTAHVLEAVDPAAALIDFASENHVDQIVIGAGSAVRRAIGPIAARVGAQAPCTVTLVRAPMPVIGHVAADEAAMEPEQGMGI